jgi:predicted 3-demethylubiquinone-9 3-methyltransferase (glyoxalase superfamily)
MRLNVQKIRPFLWFDNRAHEAAHFYASIFPNSKVDDPVSLPERALGDTRASSSVTFELDGQQFIALNGGPHFTFSPAISFFVRCETQAEIDEFWEKLGAGGATQRCGWLTDKFGVSWQIVPAILGELLEVADASTSGRVMAAMLEMTKLDIAGLEAAAAAGPVVQP